MSHLSKDAMREMTHAFAADIIIAVNAAAISGIPGYVIADLLKNMTEAVLKKYGLDGLSNASRN